MSVCEICGSTHRGIGHGGHECVAEFDGGFNVWFCTRIQGHDRQHEAWGVDDGTGPIAKWTPVPVENE